MPTTRSLESSLWATSPRDNRRTPTKLCARSRRPVVEFTDSECTAALPGRTADRAGGPARPASPLGVRLADDQGLQGEPGAAARRRGRVLRAALDRAVADPDGDRADALHRPGRAAGDAQPISRVARAEPVEGDRRRARPFPGQEERRRLAAARDDDLLQLARVHGARERD